MRRAWACIWRACATCLLALAPAHAEVVDVVAAQVCSSLEAACSTERRPLPYYWDAVHPAQAGSASFVIRFSLAAQPQTPYAIYLLRIGNAYEVSLNGTLIDRAGDWRVADGADFAKQPRLIALPAGVLGVDNELRIQLRADVGRRAGLSALHIGPTEEVQPLYRADYRRRVLGSVWAATLSAAVAALAVALWASQGSARAVDKSHSRRDPAYLYGAIAQSGWALFLFDPVVEAPLPGWPWWGLLVGGAFATGVCAMTLFCQHIAELDTRRSRWWMLALFSAGLASAALVLWAGVAWPWVVWIAGVSVFYALYGFYFGWACLRRPSAGKLLLAAAVLCNVLAGLYDWFGVLASGDLYGDYASGRFLPALYGVSLGFIMVSRFRAASLHADELTANMAAQVSLKEQELQSSYQSMEQLVREQERATERTRILRDMHDGVGSHISSAIRQLQSGKSDRDEVLLTLRDSLDQLKLTIDAMNLPRGDVTALLANMRYRLEPRFAASDIELQWQVDLLAPLAWLDADAMRQLQYMVFEALSNVLQHSHASRVQISARAVADGVELSVADNGRGFDVTAPLRKGLSSLHARAAAIGARAAIASAPGRTVVGIVLPAVAVAHTAPRT